MCFWSLMFNNYNIFSLLYLTLPFSKLSPFLPHSSGSCISPTGFVDAGPLMAELQVSFSLWKPQRWAKSAFSCGHHQRTLVVVFSLCITPLESPCALLCGWNLPWGPTSAACCWDLIVAAHFQIMLSSFLTIFVDHSPLFPFVYFLWVFWFAF